MSTLKEKLAMKKAESEKPFRVLIYGQDGVGKSTFAAEAPNPFFIDIEDGLHEILLKYKNAESLLSKTFDDVIDNLRLLYREEHNYKTVVTDSLDFLETLIHTDVCANYETDKGVPKPVTNIAKIGYGNGPKLALEYWQKLLDAYDALRNKRNMNVILIAHAQVIKVDSPLLDAPIESFAPALDKHALSLVRNWVDATLFASVKFHTKGVKTGFQGTSEPPKKLKAVGDSERVIYTQYSPAYIAKNRYNLPEEIPLSFSSFFGYAKGGVIQEEKEPS